MAKVVIVSLEHGPNLVLVDGKASYEFCICGHSSNKPFCDMTHRRVGFKAARAETTISE